MIIWIIGLSGAGKSVIGRELHKRLKLTKPDTVFIDGDEIREIFKNDKHFRDYTTEGRRKNAERIRELCVWLDRQKVNVVCCILSIFEENHRWNRENFKEYFEVFVDAPFDDLVERNPKNLYRQAQQGLISNVVGIDIEFIKPKYPDIIINNPHPFRESRLIVDEVEIAMKKKFPNE